MITTYHVPFTHDDPIPKRGDLLQSNIGKRTERTWLILKVRELPLKECKEMGGIVTFRYKIWAERWWELEPRTRVLLHRSAERAGGQVLHGFKRFPAKRKARTFGQFMEARRPTARQRASCANEMA
jgi:hypothetical protein